MRTPRIKIGATVWGISEVAKEYIDCDGQTSGDQSEERQDIRISETLGNELKIIALIHEVLHCINSQLEHETVEFLAQTIGQVLIENKLVEDWQTIIKTLMKVKKTKKISKAKKVTKKTNKAR